VSRLACILALACLPVLVSVSAALAQEARFELSLAWTEPEIDEEPNHMNRTIYVTLGERGKVTEQVRRRYGGGQRGQGGSRTSVLGDDFDGTYQARWKVVNDRTLVRLAAERSHTFAIWLTHDGAGSCSVRLEWRLKPGFKTYERWAVRREETVRFNQPAVERASCRAY